MPPPPPPPPPPCAVRLHVIAQTAFADWCGPACLRPFCRSFRSHFSHFLWALVQARQLGYPGIQYRERMEVTKPSVFNLWGACSVVCLDLANPLPRRVL